MDPVCTLIFLKINSLTNKSIDFLIKNAEQKNPQCLEGFLFFAVKEGLLISQ